MLRGRHSHGDIEKGLCTIDIWNYLKRELSNSFAREHGILNAQGAEEEDTRRINSRVRAQAHCPYVQHHEDNKKRSGYSTSLMGYNHGQKKRAYKSTKCRTYHL